MTTSIADLPNEILLDIMWLLVLGANPKKRYSVCGSASRNRRRRRSSWGFLTVTHVCSHWRQLVISTPILWSLIDLSDKHGALLCLDRSSDLVPLHATGPPSWSRARICSQAVKAFCTSRVVERLASLQLYTGIHVDTKDMSRVISLISSSTRLPHLRHLELRLSYMPEALSPSDPNALHIRVGGDTAPRLTRLSLCDIYPVFSPYCFSGLQTLRLQYYTPELFAIDLEQFLASFGTHNCLQELCLSNICLNSSSASSHCRPSNAPSEGYFPSLTQLFISCCSNVGASLSRIGPCMRTEQTFILYEDGRTLLDATPPNLLAVQPFVRQNGSLRLKMIFEAHDDSATVILEDTSSSCEKHFCVAVSNMPMAIGHDQSLMHTTQIFGQLPIQHLFISSCSDDWVDMEPAFAILFNGFTGIQILDLPVDATCALHVLSAHGHTVLCPSLREIRIKVRKGNNFPGILACVDTRHAYRLQWPHVPPIERLVITTIKSSSPYLAEFIDGFRAVVDDVVCRRG